MKRLHFIAVTLGLALLAGDPLHAVASESIAAPTVVLLPFENLTGADDGEREVTAMLIKAVEQKGWKVAAGEPVSQTLEEGRVRYLDSIDASTREALLGKMQADAVLSGVLYAFRDERGAVVALSARMVRRDGSLAWGDVVSKSADSQRILGLGAEPTAAILLQRAVQKLMVSFPLSGKEGVRADVPGRPFFLGRPVSYRAPDLDPARPHRVCILPFENLTSNVAAPRIVADILAVRMAGATAFEVVEPAALRAGAAKGGVATFRDITVEGLRRLAPAVGTTLFVKGTIFDFVDPAAGEGGDPHIQLELTVLDAENDRVVWSAQHARKGSEYTGLLMLGAVTTAVSLADRVIGEMIDAGTRPAPAGEAAVTANGTRRVPEKHSSLRGRGKE